MKKPLLFTLLGLAAGTTQAQITLSLSNVAHSPNYLARISQGSDITSAPAHGANRTWDYSSLQPDDNYQLAYAPPTRAGFTSFTRFYNGNSFLGVIPLPSEYYSQINAGGLYEVGSYKLPQAIGVGSFSGNNADTLRFAGSNNIFTTPAALLKFPCTYGNTWKADHVFNTPFSLTVSAFMLNNTPGSQRQRVYKTDSVVGWGKLILPTSSGPSNPMNVLLVKVSKYLVDSYFLSGNPAPAALLNAFGLAQSDTSYLNTYEFYAAGGDMPVLSVWMDAEWEAEGYEYRTNGVFPLANNTSEVQSAQIYPNPVKAGEALRIDLNASNMAVQLNLFDLQGRQVFTWNGNADAAAKGVQIPGTLSRGNYIYQVSSKQAMLQNGKITVE